MAELKRNFWIARSGTQYEIYENEEYTVWCAGVLVSQNDNGHLLDPLVVGCRAYEGNADYNKINGWFDIVVHAKKENEWLFWGDNSGSRYFYVDYQNGLFCDSLLAMRARLGKSANLNMRAVAQLFNWGRVLGEDTIVEGIYKTDPGYYYILRNGIIEKKSKALHTFKEMRDNLNLDDIIGPTLEAIGDKKICAVCTGGTDSRAVLACLAHRGIFPDVVITGHKDNPDICVARKVSEKLGEKLTVIEPADKEPNWLEKAFVSFDGAYDVVLCYRHMQKKRCAQAHGFDVEFGGVGGEFYKNAFCHFFRWGIIGSKSRAYFFSNLFKNDGINAAWCGRRLRSANEENKTQINAIIDEALKTRTLLQRCNTVGLSKLSCGAGSITNGYGDACSKIDPLMDRRLIASVSWKKPLLLSMHMWQRKEINRFYPALSEIGTDQGYSCSLEPHHLLLERCKRLAYYSKLILTRVKRKLRIDQKRKAAYWDSDYEEARKTELWKRAVELCKKNGIVSDGICADQIPLAQTGWILLIGMMFGEEFYEMPIGDSINWGI